MRKYILLYLLMSSVCYAQNKPMDSIVNALEKDQLLFEKVFIHTNKNTYLNEDTIWFKAYVSTNDNKPSYRTTLLYVNLFSESGNLIDSKSVLIQDGVGTGQFELSTALQKGSYYIQAFTNYMKNFGSDNKQLQKITILGAPKQNILDVKPKYDIQLFPEGGHLLEGVVNTIGIKALINGKGFDYTGEILNSKNETVVSFKNEHLGLSTCKWNYKTAQNYKAKVTINDTIIILPIPKALKTGVTLHVNNLLKEDVVEFQLETNITTQTSLQTNYTLLFHQNNKVIDYVDVNFTNEKKIAFEIDAAGFLRGVNTVTVFKNKQPILERQFFIEKENLKTNLSIEKQITEKDSTTYKLKLSEGLANVSVSVLPESAMEELARHSIESAFLLSAYVKGFIESPTYYFNKENKKRKEHIDLLLLTQGWTQYELSDFIVKHNPKYKYNFEMGFKLEGRVTPLYSNNLALLSRENVIVNKLFLNNKKTFSFKNLLAYKGDSIKLSFVRSNYEAIKPLNIYFDNVPKKQFSFNHKFDEPYTVLQKEIVKPTVLEQEVERFNLTNINTLNEVALKGKTRSKAFVERKAFDDKYRKYDFFIGTTQILEIDEKYVNANKTLGALLRNKESVTIRNWKGVENYLVSGTKEASMSIDGRRVQSDFYHQAFSIEMQDVEAIVYKRHAHHIHYQIFTTDNYKNNIKELFKKYYFQEGYDRPKKYYTPIYGFEAFSKYQDIDWKPNIPVNEKGEAVFKINRGRLSEDIVFSIQGFTNSGKLISDTVVIE